MCLNVTKFVLLLSSEELKENCADVCEVVPHPPLLTRLVPCAFFLFPKLVDGIRGKEI